MRRILVPVLAVLCAQAAFAGENSLVAQLRLSREELPAFAGLYLESLRISPTPQDNRAVKRQGDTTVVSWGDHDSDMYWEYAVGPNESFQRLIGDKKDAISPYSVTDLCSHGKWSDSNSGGRSGGFTTQRTPGLVNPASTGYEIRIGQSITDHILQGRDLHQSGDTSLSYSSPTDGDVTVTLQRIEKQTVVSGIRTPTWERKVLSWASYRGKRYPSKVQEDRVLNNGSQQHFTYTLVSIIKDPEERLTWHGWQEGAIVKDEDTETNYRYRNGKLVLEPLLNANNRAVLSAERLAFLAGVLAFGGWLVFRFGTRHRSSPANGV